MKRILYTVFILLIPYMIFGAMKFNGTTATVYIATTSSLDLTGDMTLEAWIYPTSWTYQNIISKRGGLEDGSVFLPYGISANLDGTLFYVCDQHNDRIQVFDFNGVYISKWGETGAASGKLRNPYKLTVDNSGNIYVADGTNYRIQKFDSLNVFVSSWGGFGSGNGKFNVPPLGISADELGYIFVSNGTPQFVQKFDSNGNFITKWGTGGADSKGGYFGGSMYDLAVDKVGMNVFVIDSNRRIQKFDSLGVFISSWGSSGTGDGQFNFQYGGSITVDPTGNDIYVGDHDNHRIQKFDTIGTYVTKWGSSGATEGRFRYPKGIMVSTTNLVYVCDFNNTRIQVFTSTGGYVKKWDLVGISSGCQYGLRMSDSGYVEFVYWTGLWRVFTGNSTIPRNKWTHVAVTYTGSNYIMDMFINGVLNKTYNHGISIVKGGNKINIGSNFGIYNFWNGYIDEVRVWNVIRSTDQIQSGMFRRMASQPNLNALWHLEDMYGDRAVDYSDLNHGIITGATPIGAAPIKALITE